MREYTHKNHPQLHARIDHVWHKQHRNDNYTLLFTSEEMSNEVIIIWVKDEEIENNPFWELTFDSEPGGKDYKGDKYESRRNS